ncbi:hypothetical protein MTR67_040007 [Solanum verrucosum]|uniref:Tf2-1-like SH3-like domain-containing protein n=1 Tax=Solanum verrucosum TaxID=315347 RepID=A0AAF0ZP33_SOLVR|nr:hypothetical protein MTR67_040007 [Solanum verrucosum]
MRFCKKGKLSPRYIGLYIISKRIGNVAYELELPLELAAVHPIFDISMLKKCIKDPSLIIRMEDIGKKDSLSYEESRPPGLQVENEGSSINQSPLEVSIC